MESTPDDAREWARLAALRHSELLDSQPEEAFDRLTRLASKILRVPVALVSLVDEHRQFFKSQVGLPEPWATLRQTPLSHSFCQHVVASQEPLVVADAHQHPLVRDNLAIRDLNVIAYAGIPLATTDGQVLGSFCAIDTQPRPWTPEEIGILRDLAAATMTEVELRLMLRSSQQHIERVERAARRASLQHAISRLLADAASIDNAAEQVLAVIGQTLGWQLGNLWRRVPQNGREELRCSTTWVTAGFDGSEFTATSRSLTLAVGCGLPGRAWAERRSLWVTDVTTDPTFLRSAEAARASLHGAIAFPIQRGSGTIAVVEFFTTALEAPDDALIETLNTISNQIGQFLIREHAEEELGATNTVHAAMLEAAIDCIIRMDHRGEVVEWNAAAERTFGYSRKEAVGRELADLVIPPEMRPRHRDGLAHYLLTGEGAVLGRRVEIEALRADGSRFPVELAITAIRLPGRAASFIGYVRDITDRRRAEREIQEASARVRMLADNIAQLVWIADGSGAVSWYNKRWYDYTGLTPDQCLGTGWRAAHHPDHVERVVHSFTERLQAGGAWEDTFPLCRSDGTYRWFLSRALPIRGDDGRVLHWFGTNTDITEQREAEHRLAETERRLQAAMSSGRIGTWCWNLQDDHVEIDARLREIFGLPAEGPVAIGALFDRIHPADVASVNAKVETARTSLGEYDFEFRVLLPSGDTRWAIARGSVAAATSGQGLQMIGVTWDTTERKRGEEAIREAEERYRLAARATNDAIWDWDFRTNELRWNEAVSILFGYPSEETLTTPASWWRDRLHPEDRDRVESGLRAVVAGAGQHWSAEYRFREADGAYAIVLHRGFVLRDESGRALRMIGAMQDITQRKRFEMELAAAKEAAEHANVAKSQFLANMSHELRTPLNAVIMYSELLQEEAEDLKLDGFIPDLDKIRNAGKHLLALINDVLDLSKIEAGKVEVYLEAFEVDSVIRDVATTVQPLAQKRGNRLEIRCDADAGQMSSDLTKVRQILFNLLSNALKFTDRGVVTLEVERERAAAGGDWVIFRVTDTGIGMTPDQLAKLFQAFTQADVSTTRKYGGTGLGLAISKRFSEMLGGSIAVTSEMGEGSVFELRLPAHAQQPHLPVTDDAVQTNLEGGVAAATATVLVVDDDPTTRDLIARMMDKELPGIRTVTAADGVEGLKLARELDPSLIFLDVIMPKLDGWAVLSALKADPVTAAIPVVMLTIVSNADMGYMLGAAEYLTKPVEREQLTLLLRKYRPLVGDVVLVVEDDPATREVLHRTLAREQWIIAEAADGRAGLEQLRRQRPALILLDLMMPGMDGFEFLEAVRADGSYHDLPVIVLTSKDLTLDERSRLSGKVERILQKGLYSREALLREVKRIVTDCIAKKVATTKAAAAT